MEIKLTQRGAQHVAEADGEDVRDTEEAVAVGCCVRDVRGAAGRLGLGHIAAMHGQKRRPGKQDASSKSLFIVYERMFNWHLRYYAGTCTRGVRTLVTSTPLSNKVAGFTYHL